MNSLNDAVSIFRYHRDMIKTYGSKSSYALGWRDTESQQIRFKALAGIGDLNGHSVLDAGCGYADLLPYLTHLYPAIGSYCGIEQIPELLNEAIHRYGDLPDTAFISGNFLSQNIPAMDYVLLSGSLNYSNTDPDFIFKAISHLYGSCSQGLGFNLLCRVPENGLLVAYKPEKIFAYCQTLSKKVLLKNDYAKEDFTVFLYH
jgi:SAM-dependent methyltransferase